MCKDIYLVFRLGQVPAGGQHCEPQAAVKKFRLPGTVHKAVLFSISFAVEHIFDRGLHMEAFTLPRWQLP
jgi:hypothetical protein